MGWACRHKSNKKPVRLRWIWPVQSATLFSEALACDISAIAWSTDLGIQLDWIDRGLVAASALNAKVARARLLEQRSRIHLAHGRVQDPLKTPSMLLTCSPRLVTRSTR